MKIANINNLGSVIKDIALDDTDKMVSKAKSLLCKEIIKDTEEFVPYDTGKLNSSVKIMPNNRGIEYGASYAEYVNNMPPSYNFNRSVHKNATSNWFGVSKSINYQKWVNNFNKNLR